MAYFSNSSEGAVLDKQCEECPLEDYSDKPCPVIIIQQLYNYDQLYKGNEQLKEAMNYLVNEKGICQIKLMVDNLLNR